VSNEFLLVIVMLLTLLFFLLLLLLLLLLVIVPPSLRFEAIVTNLVVNAAARLFLRGTSRYNTIRHRMIPIEIINRRIRVETLHRRRLRWMRRKRRRNMRRMRRIRRRRREREKNLYKTILNDQLQRSRLYCNALPTIEAASAWNAIDWVASDNVAKHNQEEQEEEG
jgi:hypothetical protein